MKKIITAAAFLLVSAYGFSQDYTIKMTMKTDGLPPDMASFGEMEMINYFKGDKYKNEINSMMVTGVAAFDGKKFVSLSEQMGTKGGYTATKAELDEAAKTDKEPEPKIEYTTEKKTIAGHECTKAILTTIGKDKKEEKSTVWFTEKIPASYAKGKKKMGGLPINIGELKGYPLEVEMKVNRMGMDLQVLMTSTEVLTTAIDDSAFSPSTEGYKMLSYKEYQEKVKAMMAEEK